MAAQRNLSLTEELEKLEQSVTLTLQEIDHNFSRAHRIVTTSILPIVEQYAEHSKNVWEGSKFWKQFFEASANVSLSGYEELAVDEEDATLQSQEDDQTATYGAQDSQAGESTARMDDGHSLYDDDSMLDDPPAMTPRPKLPGKHAFDDYPSQYENIRRELKGTKPSEEDEDMTEMPTTPATQQRIPDMSMTPSSSPFPATSHLPETTRQRPTDPLLHRVLDKNYRIQATPHTAQRRPERQDTTHRTPVTKRAWQNDSSPMSSPVMAPQLHSEIFSSPIARGFHTNAPRTPGVSVQTPAKGQARDETTRRFSAHMPRDEIDWQSDSDDGNPFGISPPKTIQFAIPQSRLLQTPAREASKRIVDDLLRTAGGGDDTEQSDSPSMVKMRNDLDDTF